MAVLAASLSMPSALPWLYRTAGKGPAPFGLKSSPPRVARRQWGRSCFSTLSPWGLPDHAPRARAMMGRMDILASYRDPLFWRFPIATVVLSAFAFLLFAAPLTFLAARDPPALRRYRLQARPPRPQRLLRPALWSWLRNNLLLLLDGVSGALPASVTLGSQSSRDWCGAYPDFGFVNLWRLERHNHALQLIAHLTSCRFKRGVLHRHHRSHWVNR